MIGKLLTKPMTFDEIYQNVKMYHHQQSLKIELQTLLDTGRILFENGKYFKK